MSTFWIVFIIVMVVLVGAMVALYFWSKKMEKKKAEQDAQLAAAAQTMSMLIIDKKKMRIKDAGLPAMVLEQTPRYLRSTKIPVVKAKVGPKVMTLIADQAIFDSIPVKKEVKAVVSGLYITGVKGLRVAAVAPEKKSFWGKLKDKVKKN